MSTKNPYGPIIGLDFRGAPINATIPKVLGLRLKAGPLSSYYHGEQIEPLLGAFDHAKAWGLNVRQAYPFDGDKSRNLGGRWSRVPGEFHEGAVRRIPNTVMKGIRLIGIDKRSEGGGAWMGVIEIEKGLAVVVDVREDLILSAALNGTIKDGYLQPKKGLIWARIGSQTRLVAVGSALHQSALSCEERKEKPKIKAKDLKRGRIYVVGNSFEVYLGKVTYNGVAHQAWVDLGSVRYGNNGSPWNAVKQYDRCGYSVDLYKSRTVREDTEIEVDVNKWANPNGYEVSGIKGVNHFQGPGVSYKLPTQTRMGEPMNTGDLRLFSKQGQLLEDGVIAWT